MDKTFVVRISAEHYEPVEGTAVSDVYIHRMNLPTHRNLEQLLVSHFSDWNVQVIPT